MQENTTIYIVDFINKQLMMTVVDPLQRDVDTIGVLIEGLEEDLREKVA